MLLTMERNASDGCERQIRLLRLQVVALPPDRGRRAGLGAGGRILPALSAGAARERRPRLAHHLRQRLVRRMYRQGRGVVADVAGRAGALRLIASAQPWVRSSPRKQGPSIRRSTKITGFPLSRE